MRHARRAADPGNPDGGVRHLHSGQDFDNRGSRCAEQIAVIRALWTEEVADFHGRWHHITHAGLNPLPVQRPILTWMGKTGCILLPFVADRSSKCGSH